MDEGGGACGLGGEEPVGRGEEPVDQEGRSLHSRAGLGENSSSAKLLLLLGASLEHPLKARRTHGLH